MSRKMRPSVRGSDPLAPKREASPVMHASHGVSLFTLAHHGSASERASHRKRRMNN